MWKYSFYHCILLLPLLECVMSADNAYNWGVYGTYFHNVDLCKGYKTKNITINSFETHYDPVADTTYFNGNTTNLRDGGVLMARVRFWKWSEKARRYEFLVTFDTDNSCEFRAIKINVLDKAYLLDDKCNIKKGTKIIKQLDIEVVGHDFMGERFFHGKYKILMDFFTAKENITCYSIVLELMDFDKLREYRKKVAKKEENVTKNPV